MALAHLQLRLHDCPPRLRHSGLQQGPEEFYGYGVKPHRLIMKDITREELLTSKEYWVAVKGYVTQLLSGDFDNKISKLVEFALAIGKVPSISFRDIDVEIAKNKIA